MDRLPLLPGFVFNDPSENLFHVSHTLNYKNGYAFPRPPQLGPGQRPLDANSVAHLDLDQRCWDPSLTYGDPKPAQINCKANDPKYVAFANKVLAFQAFSLEESCDLLEQAPRVRHVLFMYHLEDDTISITEPPVANSGFVQGKVLRRHRISKSDDDQDEESYWLWKDLNVGYDVWLYGRSYHLASCDAFTREFLTSQGVEVGTDENVPEDPYTAMQKAAVQKRADKEAEQQLEEQEEQSAVLDKLGRFLIFDRQVLRFFAVEQSASPSENDEQRRYRVLFYLSDGSLEVRPEYQENDGQYHFPKLLARQPLRRHLTRVDFPSLSTIDAEFYKPEHLRVGEIINILGRSLFLYDCDDFTREYYSQRLGSPQPASHPVGTSLQRHQPVLEVPPHNGFGSPEDSLQSCLRLIPRAPRLASVCPLPANAEQPELSERPLRYSMRLESQRPADQTRRFVLSFDPRRGRSTISELIPSGRMNSSVLTERFLGPTRLEKPVKTQEINPQYYGPQDFSIGSVVEASGNRFVITTADVYVLRWLSARRGHFPQELEQKLHDHLQQQGLLKD